MIVSLGRIIVVCGSGLGRSGLFQNPESVENLTSKARANLLFRRVIRMHARWIPLPENR